MLVLIYLEVGSVNEGLQGVQNYSSFLILDLVGAIFLYVLVRGRR